MLILLTILNILNMVDRNLIASFAPQITADLNLSDFEYGLLTGLLFVCFYAVMGLFVGRLADRVSRPKLIAAGLALWSALTAVSGATKSFIQIGTARLFIGVGEACLTPAAMSMIADLYPQHKRGAAAALYYLGIPLGAGTSFVVAGFLGPKIGWRNCFYLLGAIGLVLVPVIYFLREPKRGQFDAKPDDALAKMGVFAAIGKVWQLCKQRPALKFAMLGAIFMNIAIAAGSFAILWLVRERGLVEHEIQTIYGGLLLVFGVIGAILGGYLSDWYQARYPGGRMRLLAYLLIIITPFLISYRFAAPDSWLFYIAMCAGFVSFMAFFGPIYATVQDLSPANMRGISIAVLLLVSNLIGVTVGGVSVGLLSEIYAASDVAQPLTWALFSVDLLGVFTIVCFWRGSVHFARDQESIAGSA